jgi:flagellar biosynthesis component FlhA
VIKGAKAYFTQQSKQILTKHITRFIQQNLSTTLSEMIAQFIVQQIENNADKLLQQGNTKMITKYLLNKIFKGLGNTVIT